MAGRRWLAAGALLAFAFALLGCSKEVRANDLEVGECVEDQATLTSADVSPVDCDEEHEYELFHRFDVADGDFPGQDEIAAETRDECAGAAFSDYVGAPPEQSEFEVAPLFPTEETWNDADDRTVLCFLTRVDGSSTEGSAEGAES